MEVMLTEPQKYTTAYRWTLGLLLCSLAAVSVLAYLVH
jgi:hypothetical protein